MYKLYLTLFLLLLLQKLFRFFSSRCMHCMLPLLLSLLSLSVLCWFSPLLDFICFLPFQPDTNCSAFLSRAFIYYVRWISSIYMSKVLFDVKSLIWCIVVLPITKSTIRKSLLNLYFWNTQMIINLCHVCVWWRETISWQSDIMAKIKET